MSSLFITAFGAVALLAPVALGAAPVAGEPVAVIGSPFKSEAEPFEIVAVAGGEVVQSVNRFIVVARGREDGFAARLYAAGAVGVINADMLRGCAAINDRASKEQS